jgi:hypothetical protein
LLPKLDFGEFAVEPAIADDAVPCRRCSRKIIRLRSACDGGKRRRDVRERAAAAKFRDAWRVFADESSRETDNIDDGQPVYFSLTRSCSS